MGVKFQIDRRVHVRGEVKYGDQWFDVDTYGTIVAARKKGMLITLDRIDGDGLATCYVKNKFISEIDEAR